MGWAGDQRVQPGDALKPFRATVPRKPASLVVDQLDIVMVLGPVISDEQQPPLTFLLDCTVCVQQRGGGQPAI